MKRVFTIVLVAIAFSAAAQKKQLRIYCLTELTEASTKFDTLQYQERWFRERSNSTTNVGRCMFFMAEWTALRLNVEHSIFNAHTGINVLAQKASTQDQIDRKISQFIFK